MANPSSNWLKSTEWLAAQNGKPDVVVVDGSFYLPAQKRDAKAEYLAGHIPGAVFFDIDAIADHSTDLPHMLPGPTQFGDAVGALGIAETDTIVVYDGAGLNSAPRIWWTFRWRPPSLEGRDPQTRSRRGQSAGTQIQGRHEHRRGRDDVRRADGA
jgi:thiosulfate/3-mercaptopyruvate sulfurtransferase